MNLGGKQDRLKVEEASVIEKYEETMNSKGERRANAGSLAMDSCFVFGI